MAEEGHKVSLNVYDLSQGLARQLSMTFLGKAIEGIWHTGVVVYGNEYYFGGGIQNTPVGKTPYGTPIRVIDLGVTHVPKDVFEMYLQEISPRYTQETYSLLTHNCNNFSNEVAQFLVGATIPEYILNLPNEVINSPMGAMFLPMIQQLETTLRAGAVPQTPQFNPITVTSAAPKVSSAQFNPTTVTSAAPKVSSASNGKVSESKSKPATSGPQNSSSNGTAPSENKAAASEVKSPAKSVKADPLGDARSKVQEEIAREFTAIMATGTFRASEAAALATKKVMQRYGHMNAAQS